MKWVKGVKHVLRDGNQTFGGEHAIIIEYADRIIMLYTWNLHNVVNPCYLNLKHLFCILKLSFLFCVCSKMSILL